MAQLSKLLKYNKISYSVTSEQLERLFSIYGEVRQVNIIEGRGFAFVEMYRASDAEKAKDALDGYDLKGRPLKVYRARPSKSRDIKGYPG